MNFFVFALIVFSAAGIALLLALKVREPVGDGSGILARGSAAVDPLLRRCAEAARRLRGCANGANAKRAASIGSAKLFHACGLCGLFISKHYHAFTGWVGGKRLLKRGGIVSFFLKDVAESKEGRITNKE